MSVPSSPQWLVWAREIQALCQTGLAFNREPYDVQRYRRMTEIAAEIVAAHTGLPAACLIESFLRQPGYATPKIDVRGAVVRERSILLVQEKVDGRWCMPGGWADVGDLPSAMVAREVLEESGMIVKPAKVIGVYDANRGGGALEFYHAFKIIFLCDILGGTLRSSDETLDARFFSFDAIPQLSSPRTDQRHLTEVVAHLDDPARSAAFD
jgi:ADP-ribose pyrophosphatase YjhB (NUDIX family)